MEATKAAKPSADDALRAALANMPIPDFAPSFTAPPPLHKARVAIVTTAGLMRPGEAPWTHDDAGFRTFGADERDVFVGHVSMSFDRVGLVADRNVFFPIDRLREWETAGKIGSVAPRHISFMGALRLPNEVSTIILDSGPRAAKLLRDDGVDIVVITPVCPACGRTALILGHVLEAQGLSTIVLASNRALAERTPTPRALFCDFPLGRPLGEPNNPEYQNRVLGAAFELLQRSTGPVLEIFPESIKDSADEVAVCTLPPRFDPTLPASVDEARALLPAWQRARLANGRTNVGVQLTPEGVPTAIPDFIRIAEGAPWCDVFDTEDAMLHAAMDIRNYYEEAAIALADHVPAARATEAWFYRNTETGRLFKNVFSVLRESRQEQDMSMMALYYIVPQSQAEPPAPWTNRTPTRN